MPNLLTRWLTPARKPVPAPEAKRSRAAPLIALQSPGRPVWSARDYASFAREGYQTNAVAHRCVRLVAETAAQAALSVRIGGREDDGHPLMRLLARPNARQSRGAFLEAVYGHLMVAGNAYVEAVALEGEPRELHALRPDRMRVVAGPDGWAEGYEYTAGGRTVRFRQDGDAMPPVLHLALFNPATTITGSRRWRPPPGRSTSTTPRAAGTRRCSTTPRAPPARWSTAGTARR